MTALAPTLQAWLATGEPVVIARVARAMGSTPREAGATMLIARGGTLGSIGGGQLEFHAIDQARALMASDERERVVDLPLGPHLGQCCGGRVVIALRRAATQDVDALAAVDAAQRADDPAALVFGAGHTGRALARLLALTPAQTTLVDDRAGVFDDLPPNVRCVRLDDPGEAAAAAAARSAFVILTHSHALDYRLADQALRRGDAAYVGMIGSATKRARFAAWFLQRGGSRETLSRLTCPIGGSGVRDKRPEIIAALTLADVTRALFAARRMREGETANGRAA